MEAFSKLFVQAPALCQTTGLVRLGQVATNGTKPAASAATNCRRICAQPRRSWKTSGNLQRAVDACPRQAVRGGGGAGAIEAGRLYHESRELNLRSPNVRFILSALRDTHIEQALVCNQLAGLGMAKTSSARTALPIAG